jgi:hypothetical protein
MKNIHILPTEKPSRLYKDDNQVLTLNTHPVLKGIFTNGIGSNQHIYITSDEEIKEEDWLFANQGANKIVEIKEGNYPYGSINNKGDMIFNSKHWKSKIILTTDQDLIKDGVQAIDDTFLEWFVKNPSCEWVEVEPDYDEIRGDYYRIVILQEEPKQDNNFYEELKHYFETTPREKVLKDWDESAELDKIGPTVEEFLGMIQETIEEAADLWATDTKNVHPADSYIAKQSFIQGAKSQQEQDKNKYSDEDMINFHKWAYLKNRVEESDKTTKELLSEWFEQYKNK